MAKNYKVVKPPQKFFKLPQVYAAFGSRPVIMYKCKEVNGVPMGGFIIAVQNDASESSKNIKEYMLQLKDRYGEIEPIYYICVREDAIYYDKGKGNVRTMPAIQEKSASKEQRGLESLPDEVLAMALKGFDKFTDDELADRVLNLQSKKQRSV